MAAAEGREAVEPEREARDAAVLLFDEPLTGLDPIGIRRMRDTIRRRADQGAAILLSMLTGR